MLDPLLIRDHVETVRRRLESRGEDLSATIKELGKLDSERRMILPGLEQARRDRKALGARIAQAKSKGLSIDTLVQSGEQYAGQIKDWEEQLEKVETDRQTLFLTLPNLPHESVPIGRSAQDNPEVRRHGDAPSLNFDPKPHWDLGAALGILDFERAAKIAGARFSVLVGAGAKLSRALIAFMLDLHTKDHNYVEVEPPFLVNAGSLVGTGNLPKFEDDLFKISGDWDLYLIPTAEVPLCNLHSNEILDGRKLPIRYTAYTPCFRSEAGSYGKDVRGLIRQHQFDKVEMVAYSDPENSYALHEELTHHAEEVLKRLGLPYRTVLLCTGDMGFAAAKTYDIEVWLPSQKAYREISSCSNTESFQARRANIRFRREGKGKSEFVHTLNGSGVAVGRALIAVLENYQQKDGSVLIPDALQPYMNDQEIIEPN
tara:strand:- start:1934 stop:3220 length:1287 start_codon:yes stop_codon:yes gene_type:complete